MRLSPVPRRPWVRGHRRVAGRVGDDRRAHPPGVVTVATAATEQRRGARARASRLRGDRAVATAATFTGDPASSRRATGTRSG